MVTKLQGWSQLEAQVLHDHVALEKQQSVSIYLLLEARRDVGGKQTWQHFRGCERTETHVFSEHIWVGAESVRVCVSDEPDYVFYGPGGWVLIRRSLWFLGFRRCIIPLNESSKQWGTQSNSTTATGTLPCTPPVLLLSEKVFGLVVDCRHRLIEAELLLNCWDVRNPYEDFGE